MALVYCTECGTQMSDQAYACPKCGHRIPQTVPLQPIPTMSTPWYFTTPAVILGLLFCWPIGLVIMWVGRVWPTWVRAAITSIYLLTIGGAFFLWFLSIKVASDQMGQHMQMMIDPRPTTRRSTMKKWNGAIIRATSMKSRPNR